jgi:hypothetical protein
MLSSIYIMSAWCLLLLLSVKFRIQVLSKSICVTIILHITHIYTGMSTFLVELDHCSRIIQCATSKSLVIIDELGRGYLRSPPPLVSCEAIFDRLIEFTCNYPPPPPLAFSKGRMFFLIYQYQSHILKAHPLTMGLR